MKTRIITAIAILAVVIPCLLMGGIFLQALVLFIVAGGTYEFSKLSDQPLPMPLVIGLVVCEVIGLYLPQQLIFPYIGIIYLFLLALPVFDERFTPKDSFLCCAFVFFFVLVGNAFIDIYAQNPRNIWMIIIATYACDSFAYFVGRFIGKHKLNERVSPKKTIEGSIGGWICAAVLTFLYGKFFMSDSPVEIILYASIFCPIFGQIGDLAFSAIKRCYNIKDYGNIFPGHGGVLDRVDSLLFNITCFYFILMVVNF